MMQLSRISLVQWHLFAQADIDLRGDGAILGRNRSGKSTLIDLIQVVMTGGSSALFRLNRSASEGKGKSERTLRGYCLGQLSDDEFLRNSAITHIALTFRDEALQRPPVTVGLCIEASLTEGHRVVGQYVAEGVGGESATFIEFDGAGRRLSAPWSVVKSRLERACAAARGALICSTNARAHIREIMRALFTERRRPEAERFARAFVLALSFENISSVQDFVCRYLLERQDLEIGDLRESIQRYRQIQREIHELEKRLNALRYLQAKIARFDALHVADQTWRGVERLALLIECGAALFDNLSKVRTLTAAHASSEAEVQRYRDLICSQEETLEGLQAQLATSDVVGRRRLAESDIKLAQGERDQLLKQLQQRHLTAASACNLLDHRSELQPLKLGEVLTPLERVRVGSGGLVPPDWPADPASLEAALMAAGQAAAARRPQIESRRDELISYRVDAERKVAELGRRINAAQQGRTTLDERSEALMAALRNAGMRPRALCEVTDITDEAWRTAAEALLGRSRETILVEPEHAPRAIEILRAGRGQYGGCRVANTRRLASSETAPTPGTLASVLRSEDPLAMAFVVFRLGSVRLASDQSDLISGGRAILQDGAHYNGIEVEVLRPQGGFKIGRSAAGLMVQQLEDELGEARSILKRHQQNVGFIEDVLARLIELATPIESNNALPSLTARLSAAEELLGQRRARLAEIVSAVDPELHARIEQAKADLRMLNADLQELLTEVGQLSSELGERKRRLNGGDAEIGSWLSFGVRRSLFRKHVGNLALLSPVRKGYERIRENRTPGKIAQYAQREAESASAERNTCEREIRDELSTYRHSFDTSAPAPGEAKILAELKPWVDENVQRLEANELIRYKDQADQAAEQVVSLFRTAFVHELNSRLSRLESDLRDVNNALRERALHGEVYTLRHQIRPEFAALQRLAKESETDDAALASLLIKGETQDSRHAAALSFISRLLEDEDFDFAPYQDYRNYYDYDLRSRDLVSGREMSFERRRGTASGAELQVPFYIVIGAALAAIYHGSRRGLTREQLGMGIAAFDEAFSKMDGANQRTLLDFYRDIGLQVVIAAPPEKRAAVMENLDWIVDVHRINDAAIAECAYIKPYAREAMRLANPEHLSDGEVRARLDELSEAAE
jgi:hypothetical protein